MCEKVSGAMTKCYAGIASRGREPVRGLRRCGDGLSWSRGGGGSGGWQKDDTPRKRSPEGYRAKEVNCGGGDGRGGKNEEMRGGGRRAEAVAQAARTQEVQERSGMRGKGSK